MTVLRVPRTAASQEEWLRRSSGAINQLIGKKLVTKEVTAATYAVENDYDLILVDTTANNVAINLPPIALHGGRVLTIKRTSGGANTLTIDANASETIDGATTLVISTQYESFTLFCHTTGWLII